MAKYFFPDEITYRTSDRAIFRIQGLPQHNTKCSESEMKHRPAVPLHPHVYNVALKQLQDSAE
jgi:hypothetical protein